MKLILYSNGANEAGKKLQEVIETSFPVNHRELYQTIESLAARFRQPGVCDTIAVLLASTRKELSNILSIRNLLSDLRIILILPDRENETVRKAYTLYPRYVGYADDADFKDVSAVLHKMFGFDFSGISEKADEVIG